MKKVKQNKGAELRIFFIFGNSFLDLFEIDSFLCCPFKPRIFLLGWSILCDDPLQMMTIYVPEKDMSYDILELIEHNDCLTFHRQTLNLYCKLASFGNQKVAHILCSHVDEDQIMYAIKSHCKSISISTK